MRILLTSLLVLTVSLLAACGGDDDDSRRYDGPALTGISITPPGPRIVAGQTAQMAVRGTYSDDSTAIVTADVTWESTNPDIASIDANGLVSANYVGTVTLTATVGDLVAHTIFTVTHDTSLPLLSLEATPSVASVRKGDELQFTATGHYADGAAIDISDAVVWSSSSTTHATINTAGLARGVGVGDTTITATSGDISANAALTVLPPLLVGLAIDPVTIGIRVGETRQLAAIAYYSDGTTATLSTGIDWVSTDPDVASVVSTGRVTGLGIGTSTITATWGGQTGRVSVGVGLSLALAGTFDVGSMPLDVISMDYNEDGNQDLIVANLLDNTLSLLAGDGTGTLSPAIELLLDTAPYRLARADFNGDGHQDIAYASQASSQVSIAAGTGTGFGAVAEFFAGSSLYDLVATDLNADDIPDLVVSSYQGNTVTVMLGDGVGGLQALSARPVGQGPASMAIADVNGDGRRDLLVVNSTDGTVSFLPSLGDGTFGAASLITVGTNPLGIAAGDFNGDGNQDFVVALSSSLAVFPGDGAGQFGTATSVATVAQLNELLTADFDLDGQADLVGVNYQGNAISILLGTGAGSFQAIQNISVGAQPFSPAVADFNNDGRLDIAVINSGGGSVSLLLNL